MGKSSDYFTVEQMQHFMRAMVDKKRVDMSGVRDEGRKNFLYDELHICGRDLARLMVFDNYEASYGAAWPIAAGVTPEIRNSVARAFTFAVGNIEEAGKNGLAPMLTRSEVVDAFQTFYAILDPKTPQNQHVRLVLQEAATQLGLAPLHNMQHVSQLVEKRTAPSEQKL